MSRPQNRLERDGTQNVSRGAADSRLPKPSQFFTRPSGAVIEAFLLHVRETGAPETFPSITNSRPSKDSRPVFLRRFSIDRKKREHGDEAPCSICSPNNPKFLRDGYLTWYPDECALRAIGPECGDAVFGGTQYADAKATFDREERERRVVDFLQRNLVKALPLLVALQALQEAAEEAARLHEQFRRTVPRTHKKLRELRKAGGNIAVSVVREKTKKEEDAQVDGPRGLGKAERTYKTREVIFGHLPDSTLLLAKFDPKVELQALIARLTDLPRLHSDDAAFLWVCDVSGSLETLENTAQTLRDSSAGYVRLADRLDSFVNFFSAPLFEALSRWGAHEDNSFQLEADASSDGTYRLAHAARWNDREQVALRPDMEKLLRRGNLPGFE